MVKIKDIKEHFNEEVIVQGFVDNIRNLQYVQFVILKDDTGKVQITIEKEDESNKDLVSIVDNLTLESTLKVKCVVKEAPKVKLGGVELIPSSIEVTSKSLNELPIDIKSKDASLREKRLDYRFLDLRRDENNLLFKCQSYIERMMREYWYNNDYTEIHTPKISASSAESGAEMFKLDYFGQQACLSQSPQFYKQMTMASGFDKIFEIGPVFRAENSHTSYHATEIEMIDVEISWINSVEDVMKEEENWIKYFISKLKEKYATDVDFAGMVLHDKMPGILQNYDVMIFPSLGEGFSLSMVEALACGLPIISSTNTGVNDFIDDGKNGFIVPVQNTAAIVDKMEWFINHHEEIPRMGRIAIETASELTWDNYHKKVAAAVREIMEHEKADCFVG